MIASLQSVLDQDRMDFTTVVDNTCRMPSLRMMRLMQWLAWKSLQCPGSLEDKFIVITLKQNRPHNIINARYSFYNINGLSSSLRERFNHNPSFFALLSILLPNDSFNIDQIESFNSFIHWTISFMKLGHEEILSPPK